MRRRDLLTALAALPAAAARAGAQQGERIRRIGYLTGATGSPEDELGVRATRALVEGLRELGWFDGRNISIEHRFSGAGRARIAAGAKELVALNPDVIVTAGGPPLTAVMAETATIPVVFTFIGDPVGSGFVTNLARPAGNVTGFSIHEAAIAGKWPQLLKEIAPQVTRALLIMEADNTTQSLLRDAAAAAAPALGVTVDTAAVREIGDCGVAVGAFAREAGGGLIVLPNRIANANMAMLHALAGQYRLPTIYSYPIFAQTGGLISYGTDPIAQFHGAAEYVDKILRGAKPGDLPVQLPTKFSLVINLKTARVLGLSVPQSLLQRADEVIE